MADGTYTWRGGFCLEVAPVPNMIVLFGASGDLACRKLIPALFRLFRRGLLHEQSRILGCARSKLDTAAYHALIARWIPAEKNELDTFLSRISYLAGDYTDPAFYSGIGSELERLERECGGESAAFGRIFYLATPSALYLDIVDRLGAAGLTAENAEGVPWRHVVLEKPFGHDLESSRALDLGLRRTLDERQIYRIDHYLGKETVQNILILRFANLIFEPVWNANYIDNVQITVAETVGVEKRAGYFEKTGVFRDMFQNHLLEMLALVAMECPEASGAESLRTEKLRLLRSIRPVAPEDVVRGQYAAGEIDGIPVPGYREEPGIPAESRTETFAAMRLFIDNPRWCGVPFFLRSGKRMPQKTSRIVINFKQVEHSVFAPVRAEDLTPNRLVLNVQPEEGIKLTIQAKQPGPKLCMGALSMDFKYASILEPGETMPDAYERLLLDCMLGDQTLFLRGDTIDCAWSLLMPVLDAWSREDSPAPFPYRSGSWGPREAERLTDSYKVLWNNELD